MPANRPSPVPRWLEALAMLVLILIGYAFLKVTGFTPLSSAVGEVASYSAIFVIGLIAASSTCLAVAGGLLLSVSARWRDTHEHASGFRRFWPLFLFNGGRLLGYFLFGGLIGLLGTAITLTGRATGVLTILIAITMVFLGLSILRLIPAKHCRIPFSRSLISRFSGSTHGFAPIFLGALTFFLPCGFTQSMQVLALGSGGSLKGGLIMFFFALGTLPALLGISLISSFAEGRFARAFLSFSGALVLMLGVLNLQNGLALTGLDPGHSLIRYFTFLPAHQSIDDPYVSVSPDGRQVISLTVTDSGYAPNSFTIDAGRETWIYATAPEGLSGCANFLTVPSQNLSVVIQKGANWLGPIRSPQSDFLITCSMGRLRANVHVKQE